MNTILINQILFRFITASILVLLPAFVAAESDAAESSIGETIPRLIEQFSRSSGIGVPELQAEDIEILLAGKSIISPSGESGPESNGGVESLGIDGADVPVVGPLPKKHAVAQTYFATDRKGITPFLDAIAK